MTCRCLRESLAQSFRQYHQWSGPAYYARSLLQDRTGTQAEVHVKEIRIGDRTFAIASIGDDDPYQDVIVDGFGEDLWRFAAPQLEPGSVVFDIGANIGLTACLFAQRATQVHAFEPNPAVFQKLAANIELNKLANVTAHQCAMGATEGEMFFEGASAYGHVTTSKSDLRVPVQTADRLVASLGLSRVDILKIDVEGFEPQVLQGAREMLQRFNPIVVMEYNSWTLLAHNDTNPIEFARRLLDDFEQVFVLDTFGPGMTAISDPVGLAYTNIVEHRCVSDLIMTPRARSFRAPLPARPPPSTTQPAVSPQARELALESELNAVLASTSWRATAPLRKLATMFRRRGLG
jgi:FkbM family methyltransferase